MPEFSTNVKMYTLISTFHFLLHKYTPHLSNVLKLSRRFAAQWNLYIMLENIKSTNFILGTNTKSRNLRIHKLVIFNQTTKIDTHKEKYFHSKKFKRVSGKETWSSNYCWVWHTWYWFLFGNVLIFQCYWCKLSLTTKLVNI